MVPIAPVDAYYSHARPELLSFLSDSGVWKGRALDVGCGEGRLGASLFGLGFDEVWGVEPEAGPAGLASTRLTHVVTSTFPCADTMAGAPYDLIVMADVLEHMLDPWQALAAARDQLSERGRIALSVPNTAHFTIVWQLMRGDWRYTTEGLLDRSHLRFFTPISLRRVLYGAGLAVVERRDVESEPGGWGKPVGHLWRLVSRDLFVVQSLVLAERRA